MRFKGLVQSNGFLQTIDPPILNKRDVFKIEDHGNLHHFPKGSFVYFTLNTGQKDKQAIIQALCEQQTVSTPVVPAITNITEFKQKKIESLAVIKETMHFYLVFNPMFNEKDLEEFQGPTQAHSFFNQLKHKIEEKTGDFLYWGKLKSSDTNEVLARDCFKEVFAKNEKEGRPTHLYISDFNNFWCGRVSGIEFDLEKSKAGEHTLNFYKNNWDRIEAWFKITDMKLLSNTARETNQFISNLKIGINNKYNSKQDPNRELRVTPYLSGLRYPLIIEDIRAESYFDYHGEEKIILRENVLMNNTETLTQQAKSTIYSYVIPEKIFNKLSHLVQNEILSAEIEYFKTTASTNEELYRKDLSVARKYLIALEKSLNDVIRDTNPPASSGLYNPGSSLSLAMICEEIGLKQHVYLSGRYKQLFEYLTSMRGTFLKLNEIRNSKIHLNDRVLDHQSVINVRRLILGVGTEGILVNLHKAAYTELAQHFQINSLELSQEKKKA